MTTHEETQMRTLEDVKTWIGMTMVDADGDKVGTIEDIYLDRQSGEPEWAAVKTGLFGLKHTFVPIGDAELAGDDRIRVPLQKEQVKDAPRIDPDGELSPDEERRLYEHYGRADYGEWRGQDRTTALDLPAERGGRFSRSDQPAGGGDAGDVADSGGAPAIVGVRLRRHVVVVAPGDDAAAERTGGDADPRMGS
jgi:sporulation protein YlmC with PRC-barrel domain